MKSQNIENRFTELSGSLKKLGVSVSMHDAIIYMVGHELEPLPQELGFSIHQGQMASAGKHKADTEA